MYCDDRVGREAARARLGIEPDRVAILLFGNQRPYKGTDNMLRAVSLLPEGMRRQVTVVIAGQAWKNAQQYDGLIASCGMAVQVKKHLKYVPMSDVKYYFEAADLVALPYKFFAAQSGVGSIALAFGKPLLVTRVGGLPSLVKREEAIAERGSVESLRDRLSALLADRASLDQLAADSREVAKGRTWDAAAERTVEIYRDMLRNRV
jgi:glycosyltransferase involved in cell wall biosynthesis